MRRDRAGVQALTARRIAGTILIAALAGCAPHARSAAPLAGATNCIVGDSSAATPDTIYVVGAVQSSDADGGCARAAGTPVVVAESPPAGADLRDVLDRGLPASRSPRPDVVVTSDASTIAYAIGSGEYAAYALPYVQTYVLLSSDSGAMPSPAERDALARNAVTADVRGAVEPFAWLADAGCSVQPATPPATTHAIVAYAAGDVIARQLAERIVALAPSHPAWIPAMTTPRVAALPADSITAAIAAGRAAAAIVALPRDAHNHCGTSAAPLSLHTVPLVDSRAHAIVRRGSGAVFVINDDGTLHFVRRKAP